MYVHLETPLYDSSTGRYEIPDLPPGKYSVVVFVDDAEPFNGERGFALDFDGSEAIEISPSEPRVNLDVHLVKSIHLTAPVDNQSALGHIDDPKDTYPLGPLLFSWEEIPEAFTYYVDVQVYKEPFSHLGSVLSKEVSGTSLELDLPRNREDEFYLFDLHAVGASERPIAALTVSYVNGGHGFDYRFRIADTPLLAAVADRAALVALYHAADGLNWSNDTNWLSDAPLGEWYGVTTDGNGRVVELVLVENGLRGEVPSEIDYLAGLKTLDLGQNQLSGEIPPALGSLTDLQRLNFAYNQLTGRIPAELGRLIELTYLNLSANQLVGEIPAGLGSLRKLEVLGLDWNRLNGEIPAELGSLARLQGLWLNNNQLNGEIPAELGSLTRLRELSLGENRLSGCIPATLQDQLNMDVHVGMPLCAERPASAPAVEVSASAPIRTSTPAATPAPERGFFVNSVPSQSSLETDLPFDPLDPVFLSLIGIMLTLVATGIQLLKGR